MTEQYDPTKDPGVVALEEAWEAGASEEDLMAMEQALLEPSDNGLKPSDPDGEE